jgi:hypothetical protein
MKMVDSHKLTCECGEEIENIDEAKEHFQSRPDEMRMNEHLDGYNFHGFEFVGFDAHTHSARWSHQDLDLWFYATPASWFMPDEEGYVQFQVEGGGAFRELQGQVVHKAFFEETLSFQEYREMVKHFIEDHFL